MGNAHPGCAIRTGNAPTLPTVRNESRVIPEGNRNPDSKERETFETALRV